MSTERNRLFQYTSIGTKREVLPPPLGNGIVLSARLLSVDALRETMQISPEIVSLLFTPEEISHSLRYKVGSHEHFAARLAAKQIALELLNSSAIGWQDVWIANNDYNSPYLVLNDAAQQLADDKRIRAIHVSLAHESSIAVAFCAVEKDDHTSQTRIVQIGADVCCANTFRPAFIRGTFVEQEIKAANQQEQPFARYAMYFAAKESVIKILETLSGWIWHEIEIHEGDKGAYYISLSGSAKERLEQMGASEIVTSLSYEEGIGTLAFSVALARPLLDRSVG